MKYPFALLIGSMAALTLAALAIASPAQAAQGPLVQTTDGELQGMSSAGVDAFLGIPYAQPPLGALRWRAPEPARSWTGVRDASRFGTNCYQAAPRPFGPYTPEFLITPPVSEDCLYLNVWAPSRHTTGLPVYFFIHGGGFGSGSGSIPIYNGRHLAAAGAVVVTINYRLGVFGFLALPALSRESPEHVSGNYGLLDIIAALRWVHDNIARFGGDPALVTIAGQSAGAAAVNDLLVSPGARGLFSRAIAESGSGLLPPLTPLGEAQQQGSSLLQKAHVSSLAALRSLSADELLRLTATPAPLSGARSPGAPAPLRFAPIDDGVVIAGDPDDPATPLQSKVPLLTGYNEDDITVGGLPPTTREQFEHAVRAAYGALSGRLLALYPHATDDQATASQTELARDRLMSGLLLWGQARERASGERVYVYLYQHPYPGPGSHHWGTFHTSEVPYIFGVLDQGVRPFTAQDRRIARQLSSYWLHFMRSGTPDGTSHGWPPLQAGGEAVMGLGDHVGPRPAVSTPRRWAALRDFVSQGGRLRPIG